MGCGGRWACVEGAELTSFRAVRRVHHLQNMFPAITRF